MELVEALELNHYICFSISVYLTLRVTVVSSFFSPVIPISVCLVSFIIPSFFSSLPHSVLLFSFLLAIKLLFLPCFSVLTGSWSQFFPSFLPACSSFTVILEMSFLGFPLRIVAPAILTSHFQKTSKSCSLFRLPALFLLAACAWYRDTCSYFCFWTGLHLAWALMTWKQVTRFGKSIGNWKLCLMGSFRNKKFWEPSPGQTNSSILALRILFNF